MLTGRRVFQGDDVTDVLVAVLSKDADWTALPAATPPAIRRLLRRSLERDAHRRLADIADARLELEEAQTTSGDEVAPAPPPRVALWRRLVLPVGAALVAGALAGVVAWTMKPAPPRPVTRFSIVLPADAAFSPGDATRRVLAVSPDGSRIAYIVDGQLYLRARNQLAAVPMARAGGVPFFSPDGQWLGFWTEGELRKVSVNGGAPVSIATTPLRMGRNMGV